MLVRDWWLRRKPVETNNSWLLCGFSLARHTIYIRRTGRKPPTVASPASSPHILVLIIGAAFGSSATIQEM